MRPLRILVGCERSGKVRDRFRRLGHEAWSNDLEHDEHGKEIVPAGEWPNYHLYGDVRWFLEGPHGPWDLAIFFPPCTYLSASGLHWNGRGRGHEKTEQALGFVRELLGAPIAHIALENPRGAIGSRIRRADQTLHPHQFGNPESKATCLWLKNLPRLRPTGFAPGRIVDDGRAQQGLFGTGVERWNNQTDSGQNKLSPSPDRAEKRSETYDGIADAMARQWSDFIACHGAQQRA